MQRRERNDKQVIQYYWDVLPMLEESSDVTEWAVGDLHVWPIVRVRLGHWLVADHLRSSRPEHARRPARSRRIASRALRSVRDQWSAVTMPEGRYAAVLLSDGVSLAETGCGLTDRCLEPLRAALDDRRQESVLFVPSVPRGHLAGTSRWVRPEPTARSAVGSIVSRSQQVHLPDYERVKDLLGERGAADGLMSRRSIAATGDLVRRWAEELSPLAGLAPWAFVSEYYSIRSMAFIHACRAAGVSTVDVQHGVAGDSHFAYGRWERCPTGGYSTLPDWFWSWSEDDALAIRRWAPPGTHRSIVGGIPWLDRRVMHRDEPRGRNAAVQSDSRPMGSVRVLYTLNADESPSESMVLDLVATSPQPWEWRLRFHPTADHQQEWGEAATGPAARRIRFVDPATESIVTSLQWSDVHMTQYSSATLEASVLGVPTVALDRLAAELFPSEVADGSCRLSGRSNWKVDVAAAASGTRPDRTMGHLAGGTGRTLEQLIGGEA